MGASRRGLLAAGLWASAFPAFAQDAAAPVVAPVRLVGGRLTIQARIAGHDPVPFGIDTGAGVSVIEQSLAATIPELVFRRSMNFGGLGGLSTAPVYEAPEVVLGERIRQAHVALVGTRPLGGVIRGLFASGLLTSLDTDLDFESEELRVWPRGRAKRPGYAPAETVIEPAKMAGMSSRITAFAELDGRRGRFLLDTGAPRNMLISPRAVDRWGLWRDDRPYAPVPTSGFGGRERRLDRMVRAGSLRIGDAVIERPLVTLHAPGSPDLDIYDGLIGLEVLQLLNLSIDSRAGTVWLKRNGRVQPRDGYSRSGVWLEQDGPRVRVADVGFGSPGAEVGLRPGDLVTFPADLPSAVAAINGRAGAGPLEILSGGHARKVTLQYHAWL